MIICVVHVALACYLFIWVTGVTGWGSTSYLKNEDEAYEIATTRLFMFQVKNNYCIQLTC